MYSGVCLCTVVSVCVHGVCLYIVVSVCIHGIFLCTVVSVCVQLCLSVYMVSVCVHGVCLCTWCLSVYMVFHSLIFLHDLFANICYSFKITINGMKTHLYINVISSNISSSIQTKVVKSNQCCLLTQIFHQAYKLRLSNQTSVVC